MRPSRAMHRYSSEAASPVSLSPGDLRLHSFTIIWVDPFDPKVAVGQPLLRRVAKKRLNPRTDIQR